MKVKASPNCRFCTGTVETIIHMLWDCPKITPVWEKIGDWVKSKTGYEFYYHPSFVLLNLDIVREEETPDIIWLLLLVIRRHFFVCKCLERTPTFTNTLSAIAEVENIERSVAVQNRSLDHHYNKWGALTGNAADGVTLI